MRPLATLAGVIATTSIGWAADMPMVVKAPAVAPAAAVEQTWTVMLDTEVRYSSWKSNVSYPASVSDLLSRGKGSQIYVP